MPFTNFTCLLKGGHVGKGCVFYENFKCLGFFKIYLVVGYLHWFCFICQYFKRQF